MNAQLAPNAVASANIQNGSVTAGKIAAGAVANSNLTANAVATTNIQNGAVTTSQLAVGAVTNANLTANAVNATNIAAGQVVKSVNGIYRQCDCFVAWHSYSGRGCGPVHQRGQSPGVRAGSEHAGVHGERNICGSVERHPDQGRTVGRRRRRRQSFHWLQCRRRRSGRLCV